MELEKGNIINVLLTVSDCTQVLKTYVISSQVYWDIVDSSSHSIVICCVFIHLIYIGITYAHVQYVCPWSLYSMCRSQPEGSTANKSTAPTPIHLSGILATGNTDAIIQWLQGMVCSAWYFSISARAFSKAA